VKVLILDEEIDLYEKGLVEDIGESIITKTFEGVLTDITKTISFIDMDRVVSPYAPQGYFYAIDWYGQPIKIIDDDNITIWDGIIQDITVNEDTRKTVILSKSVLSTFKKKNIAYKSSGYENPIVILKSILDKYDFPYDSKTLQESETYVEGNLEVSVSYTLEEQKSIFDIINSIAFITSAYAYIFQNTLYFEVWEDKSGIEPVRIEEEELISLPQIKTLTSKVVNAFNIEYKGSKAVLTIGTADLSGGYDFSINNETFLIEVGGIEYNVILFANALDLDAVVDEVNIRLFNKGIFDVEAFADGDNIGLRGEPQSIILSAGSPDALSILGFSAGERITSVIQDDEKNRIGSASVERYGLRETKISLTGAGESVIIKDMDSAAWVGEQKIKISHTSDLKRARAEISIRISIERSDVDINSVIAINYLPFAWDGKKFEVFETKYDTVRRYIDVRGREV